MLAVIDSVILLDDKPMNCQILLNYVLLLCTISDVVRFYWRQFECIALLLIYFIYLCLPIWWIKIVINDKTCVFASKSSHNTSTERTDRRTLIFQTAGPPRKQYLQVVPVLHGVIIERPAEYRYEGQLLRLSYMRWCASNGATSFLRGDIIQYTLHGRTTVNTIYSLSDPPSALRHRH